MHRGGSASRDDAADLRYAKQYRAGIQEPKPC
jgi:hypothetical protein